MASETKTTEGDLINKTPEKVINLRKLEDEVRELKATTTIIMDEIICLKETVETLRLCCSRFNTIQGELIKKINN